MSGRRGWALAPQLQPGPRCPPVLLCEWGNSATLTVSAESVVRPRAGTGHRLAGSGLLGSVVPAPPVSLVPGAWQTFSRGPVS